MVMTVHVSGSDRALLLRIVGSYCSKEKKKKKNSREKINRKFSEKGYPKNSEIVLSIWVECS